MRVRIVYLQAIYAGLSDEQKDFWCVGDIDPACLTDNCRGATKFRKDGGVERCVEVNGVTDLQLGNLQVIKDNGYIVELFVNSSGDNELPLNSSGQTVNEWRAGRADLYVAEGV